MRNSSGAKPDMALLRLIKESELRRGSIVGSGAFGAVYKVNVVVVPWFFRDNGRQPFKMVKFIIGARPWKLPEQNSVTTANILYKEI